MRYLDISFDNPQENICFDEALLKAAENNNGDETLRFWESDVLFIVLGRIGKIEEDLHIENVLADKIPALRRSSGGGTVIQGKGCLNFTLVLSKEKNPAVKDLNRSYQYILERIVSALDKSGIEAQYFPVSDIALKKNEKKFSGNAQKRMRHFIMHHGTILYDFNLALISRYLKLPQSVPDYRKNRSHEDFVTNIDVNSELLKKSISAVFGVDENPSEISEAEGRLLEELLESGKMVVELPSNISTNNQ